MAGVSGTFAGSKLEIGTTATIDFTLPTTAEAAFAADAYVEIGEISTFGEMGSTANVLKFPVVSDEYVRKSKGTRDAGDPALVVGFVADDPGQIALRAAETKKYYYNFRMTLQDAQDENHTNTVIYFRAIVAGAQNSFGGNEDYVTETYTLGIWPKPLPIYSAPVVGP